MATWRSGRARCMDGLSVRLSTRSTIRCGGWKIVQGLYTMEGLQDQETMVKVRRFLYRSDAWYEAAA